MQRWGYHNCPAVITLHYYLDLRAVKPGSPAPLKLGVGKRQRTAYVLTGISLLPSEWDGKAQKVINHPRRKALNSDLARMKANAEDYLRPMLYRGELADLSVTEIRDLVKAYFYGHITRLKLADAYSRTMKSKGSGTASIYATSWKRMLLWKPAYETMELTAVTTAWVQSFNEWLINENYKGNTIATTFRCFRAVWNDAVRAGEVSGDPFKGVNTSPVQTRGRDLSLEQIRKLWRAETRDEREAQALDCFKLSFLLRAINPVDLMRMRHSDISNGRLYYNRQKTGKAISAKVEPEASEIIAKRGDKTFIFSHGDILPVSLCGRTDRLLPAIAKREGLPPVTMYYARHTLASLLFEQGGTMDVVSAILSHSLGGARVTATYVAVREAKLDEAMRNVIDAVVKD